MRSPCFRQPAAFSFLFPDPNGAAIDEVRTPPSQNPDTRHKLSTLASSQVARPASIRHQPSEPATKPPIRPHAPIDTPGQSATLDQLIVRHTDSPFASEPTPDYYPVRLRDATPVLFVRRTLQLFENAVKVAAPMRCYFPETGVCLPTLDRVLVMMLLCKPHSFPLIFRANHNNDGSFNKYHSTPVSQSTSCFQPIIPDALS